MKFVSMVFGKKGIGKFKDFFTTKIYITIVIKNRLYPDKKYNKIISYKLLLKVLIISNHKNIVHI